MAVLNVTTFTQLAKDASAHVAQAAQHPAANGGDFDATTKLVRLHSDANCFYLIAPGAVVTTATGSALPADTIEYVAVTQGSRISVIQA